MTDNLNYPTGQPLRPFSEEFRRRWNDAAYAAEALYNPQTDAQGQFDLTPGVGLSYQQNPMDAAEGAGPIPQGQRMLATTTGSANNSDYPDTHYTAVQAVWDDSEAAYITLPNGHVFDSEGTDLTNLVCRQGFGSVPNGVTVEVWPELGDDGLLQWVFDGWGSVIPCTLTMVTGINGVYRSSAPTWAYSGSDLQGNPIFGEEIPENQRDECTYTVATKGLAYLDDNGNFKLAWANEEIDLPELTTPGVDNYGYWQLGAFTDATGARVGAVGGAAAESAPGGAGGTIEFAYPERQSCGDNYIGVQTFVVNGTGTDEVHQWIDFSTYKAECPPADGDYLVWDTNSWEVGTPVEAVVITDVRIDESTKKLQVKKQVLTVFATADVAAQTPVGDWVDVHTGVECE